MQCIFFQNRENNPVCFAKATDYLWNVDEETIKKFCQTDDFEACIRFHAYMALQRNKNDLKVNTGK